jgi:hypothetical protein
MRIEIPFLYPVTSEGSPLRWYADVLRTEIRELASSDVDGTVKFHRNHEVEGERYGTSHPIVAGRILRPNEQFLRKELAGNSVPLSVQMGNASAGRLTHAPLLPLHYQTSKIDPRPESGPPGPEGDVSREYHRERAASILADIVLIGGRVFDGSTDPVSILPPGATMSRNPGKIVGWLDPRFGWRTTFDTTLERGSSTIPPFRTIDPQVGLPPEIAAEGDFAGFRNRLEEESINAAHALRGIAGKLLGVPGKLPGKGLRDLLPALASLVSRYEDPFSPAPAARDAADLMQAISSRIEDPLFRGLYHYPHAIVESLQRDLAIFDGYWKDHGSKLSTSRPDQTFEAWAEEAYSTFSM